MKSTGCFGKDWDGKDDDCKYCEEEWDCRRITKKSRKAKSIGGKNGRTI